MIAMGEPECANYLMNVIGLAHKAHGFRINVTGEDVLGLPTITGKPVMVLSALQSMKEKSALADDANEKRKDIARLYPGSKQIWVDSGHGIPLENPEKVISAIREVLRQQQSNSP